MAKGNSLAETELTVLAVLLNDSHAIIPVMEVLQDAEQFSDQERRTIYGTILELTKEATVPNVHTVAARSGIPIEQLQEIARRFNTKANKEVRYLADVVAKEAQFRRLDAAIDYAKEMTAERPQDIEGLVFTSIQMIGGVCEGKTERDPGIAAVCDDLDAEIQELAKGGLIGYSTGLDWLDDKTGGFCPSHVWVVSAPYKGRKTTLARNMILQPLRKGASVSIFALEGARGSTAAGLQAMLATEKLDKWGCSEEMILSETFIMRGRRSEAQQQAITEAKAEMRKFNLRIYDGRDRIGRVERIAYKIQRDRFIFGMNIFVADYVQLIGQGKLFDRLENSTHVLQQTIVEQGVTGILLAQLGEAAIKEISDDADDNYSPGVKGGGDPAAAADFLIRTKYNAKKTPDLLTIELKLARHAAPGSCEYRIHRQSGRILRELGAVKEQD